MSVAALDRFRAATWAGRYHMLLTGEVTPDEVLTDPEVPEPLRKLCQDPDRSSVAASFERHGLLEQVRRALPHDDTCRDMVACDLALAYRRGKLTSTGEVLHVAGVGTLEGAATVSDGEFRAELYRAAADALTGYAARAGERANDGGKTSARCGNQAARALTAAWRISRAYADAAAALTRLDDLDHDGAVEPDLWADYGELLGYRFLDRGDPEALDRTIEVLTRAVGTPSTPAGELPEAHRRLGLALAQRALDRGDVTDRERAEDQLQRAADLEPGLAQHCAPIRARLGDRFG